MISQFFKQCLKAQESNSSEIGWTAVAKWKNRKKGIKDAVNNFYDRCNF